MNILKIKTIILVISFLINPASFTFASSEDNIKHFDIKVSLEEKSGYKGVVIGTLFLIKIEINNLTADKYNIGDYFRVLMTTDENASLTSTKSISSRVSPALSRHFGVA